MLLYNDMQRDMFSFLRSEEISCLWLGKNLYSQPWVAKKNFNVGGKKYCYFV